MAKNEQFWSSYDDESFLRVIYTLPNDMENLADISEPQIPPNEQTDQ